MANQLFTHTLQFGSEKYMITKRFYQEILAETNYIGDYNECKSYVYRAMNKCFKEIQQVADFPKKKIDFEI
jgi:hypothetical protein